MIKIKPSETKQQHRGVLSALSQTPQAVPGWHHRWCQTPATCLRSLSALQVCSWHSAGQQWSRAEQGMAHQLSKNVCALGKVTRFFKGLSKSVTSLSSTASKSVREGHPLLLIMLSLKRFLRGFASLTRYPKWCEPRALWSELSWELRLRFHGRSP